MGVSKVVYDNVTLIDLSNDTVEADKLAKGYTAHGADGNIIVGTSEGGGSFSTTLTFAAPPYCRIKATISNPGEADVIQVWDFKDYSDPTQTFSGYSNLFKANATAQFDCIVTIPTSTGRKTGVVYSTTVTKANWETAELRMIPEYAIFFYGWVNPDVSFQTGTVPFTTSLNRYYNGNSTSASAFGASNTFVAALNKQNHCMEYDVSTMPTNAGQIVVFSPETRYDRTLTQNKTFTLAGSIVYNYPTTTSTNNNIRISLHRSNAADVSKDSNHANFFFNAPAATVQELFTRAQVSNWPNHEHEFSLCMDGNNVADTAVNCGIGSSVWLESTSTRNGYVRYYALVANNTPWVPPTFYEEETPTQEIYRISIETEDRVHSSGYMIPRLGRTDYPKKIEVVWTNYDEWMASHGDYWVGKDYKVLMYMNYIRIPGCTESMAYSDTLYAEEPNGEYFSLLYLDGGDRGTGVTADGTRCYHTTSSSKTYWYGLSAKTDANKPTETNIPFPYFSTNEYIMVGQEYEIILTY